METGVGERGPDVATVAGHGVVEAAVPQQPEIGHLGLPGCRRVGGRPTNPPAAQQIRGQGVDRFQHGQAAQGGLDAPGRGGPGRVRVVGATPTALVSRITGGEGGVALVLQVDGMVVVQGEPLPVVLGQFPLGVEGGQACGSCLLPGSRMLVVGDVERFHGPSGQPTRRRAPSILLTFSSSKPSTGARLATLARGILADIFNSCLCSLVSGSRRGILVPPLCITPPVSRRLTGCLAAVPGLPQH